MAPFLDDDACMNAAVRGMLAALAFAGAMSSVPAQATADGPDYFRMRGVAAGHYVSLRAEPSASAAPRARLRADARCVRNLGCRGGLTFEEFTTLSEDEQRRREEAHPRWCKVEHQGTVAGSRDAIWPKATARRHQPRRTSDMRFACEAVRLSIGEMPASQVRGMTSRTARRIRLAALLLAMVGPVAAQVPPDQLRAQVESARLGTGYAQMINLSATPDLSAASYRVDMGGGPDSTLDVLRLPYQAKWLSLSADSDLYWKVAGGYLRLKHDFPYALSPAVNGSVGSNWTAYSVSGGVLAKVRLGNGFTLEPALDAAVARLENSMSYVGAASILQPILDGLVFNWTTNAWLVTPSVGLEWTDGNPDGKTTVRGHVARSWITSFDETDPIQHFSEAANIYSVRAEYSRPTQMRVFDRPLAGVVYAGYAGFFGADRHALGFDAVAEVGAGLELPIAADKPLAERARLSGAFLFGTDVRGWTIGISVEY